jgi:MFS family permease
MVVGRAFAEPVVHRFSPSGVLLISAILAALGLYILGHSTGTMLFIGALIFGIGVCYFWPTMLGFVAENLPRTGAVGLNFMGGAGMFAVSIYMIFMGGYYDRLIANRLPAGADVASYSSPEATPEMVAALNEAKRAAGPEIINTTLVIPIILIIAFAILFFYMRGRNNQLSPAADLKVERQPIL